MGLNHNYSTSIFRLLYLQYFCLFMTHHMCVTGDSWHVTHVRWIEILWLPHPQFSSFVSDFLFVCHSFLLLLKCQLWKNKTLKCTKTLKKLPRGALDHVINNMRCPKRLKYSSKGRTEANRLPVNMHINNEWLRLLRQSALFWAAFTVFVKSQGCAPYTWETLAEYLYIWPSCHEEVLFLLKLAWMIWSKKLFIASCTIQHLDLWVTDRLCHYRDPAGVWLTTGTNILTPTNSHYLINSRCSSLLSG